MRGWEGEERERGGEEKRKRERKEGLGDSIHGVPRLLNRIPVLAQTESVNGFLLLPSL